MSSLRCLRSILRVQNAVRVSSNNVPSVYLCCKRQETTHAVKYTSSRRKAEYLRELYHRRLEVGPEKERHPSTLGCWSHDAEINAFGQRFGEEFNQKFLMQAFTMRSYIDKEEEKQRDLGLDVEFEMTDNEDFAEKGHCLASRYIKAYLRYSYPQMFEEGICAIHDYLMSETTLLNIGQNIGLRELIQSAEYPPCDQDYKTTFLAVIGALAESQNTRTAELFVADLILPQLIAKDVNEIWVIRNPMGLLSAMLKVEGRGEPEPRLLRSSAQNTIMAVHEVGIYSDKQFIAKSPGESVIIAEEMAAREAIKTLLKTSDHHPPLTLGESLRDIELDYNKLNKSVTEVLSS